VSFKADHERIWAFGGHLLGLGDDANDAKAYVQRHFNATVRYDMSRMFRSLAEAAKDVAESLTANYEHLAEAVMASGVEVQRRADDYRRNDQRGARRIGAAGRG
jgi:thiamine monophosphate kinase